MVSVSPISSSQSEPTSPTTHQVGGHHPALSKNIAIRECQPEPLNLSNRTRLCAVAYNTNFCLRLHYSVDAGKKGHAEAIPLEAA
jgi:hypothetical protein